jgi:hypothetical protein
MIGKGPTPETLKKRKYVANMSGTGTYGIVMYDGPFELNDVHFENFSQEMESARNSAGVMKNITVSPIGKVGGASKYVNRSKSLSFSPEPLKRIDLFPGTTGWKDEHLSQALLDIDGTLAGQSNSIITTKNSFNKTSACSNRNQFNAIVCEADNYKIGSLTIFDFSQYAKNNKLQNKFFFNTSRNNVHLSHPTPYSGQQLHSKVNLVLNTGQTYKVNVGGKSLNKKFIRYQSHFQMHSSGIIRIRNISPGQSCALVDLNPSPTLNALRTKTTSGYYSANNGDLLIKMIPQHEEEDKFTGAIKAYYDSYHVSCS